MSGGSYAFGGGINRVAIADSYSSDAFSRLRVANPEVVFDSQHEYGQGGTYWYSTYVGALSTSAQLPNESVVLMTCGTEANASVVRQTKQYFRYQPGKSQLIIMTFTLGTPVSNVVRRVGYYDSNNGLFLEQNGTTDVAVVRRTFTSGAPVDNRVPQSQWNIDKMNGLGPSGKTLDLSKAQILVIDFQWLGVGRVRFGFDIDGVICYVHQMLHANVLPIVYMQTANLPLRYEIANLGVQGGTNTMREGCSTVVSEGGRDQDFSFHFSANQGITGVAVTTRRAVLSIRPMALHNGKTNRVAIQLDQVSLLSQVNGSLWELVYNPTFTGTPVWTQQDANGFSAIEYSRHADAAAGAFTGGMIIDSGYAAADKIGTSYNNQIVARYPLVLDPTGANPIALSLVCTSLTGTATCFGELGWYEVR